MNKEELLDKYLYHSKDEDGNKLFDRELCLRAMQEYAIAMCEEQKKACLTNLIELSDKVYQVVPDSDQNAILQTKNVAE